MIENHYPLLYTDREGKTFLVLDLPASSEGIRMAIKAQVLSGHRIPAEHKFQSDARLQFLDLSAAEEQYF